MLRFLMNWLSGGKSQAPARSRQVSVRPSLEPLEEREVPTGFNWLGNYTPPGGYYGAGTQRVSFFAEEVQGSFTAPNAQQAWATGMNLSLGSHGTLSTNATDVLDRTTPQHFLLIGWENLNTHVGGWMAAKYDGSYGQLVTTGPWWNQHTSIVEHSTMDWMSNDGQGQHNVEGWFTMNYSTNGYHLGLSVAPDANGNMHANFTPPH